MKEHGRAGQHPQQGEGPHADPAAEQFFEPCDHPAPWRTPLRMTSTRGGSALCQDVTLASRYRVSSSRGVLFATQSSADSRSASWLSSPASAWWRIEGYVSPRSCTSSSQRYPDHASSIGTRRPSAVTRTTSARQVLDSGNIWNANSLWADQYPRATSPSCKATTATT